MIYHIFQDVGVVSFEIQVLKTFDLSRRLLLNLSLVVASHDPEVVLTVQSDPAEYLAELLIGQSLVFVHAHHLRADYIFEVVVLVFARYQEGNEPEVFAELLQFV